MREELNVEELFASKVFTLGKMKERLPKSTYKEVKKIMDRVFPRRNDIGHVGVAGQRELRAELLGVERLALLEEEGVGREIGRWCETVGCRRSRHQQHVALAARDGVERRQSFGYQVVVRRKTVVGQRFPVRQQTDPQLGREPRNLVEKPLRVAGAGGQDSEQTLAADCQLRHRQCIGRAGKGWQLRAFAGLEGGQGDRQRGVE